MFLITFVRLCAIVKDYKMLTYGVMYLGCWSIFLQATSQATETVTSNLVKSGIELGSTNSLDIANELSYQPKIQVSIPFFTPRFIRGEDVQLRERVDDMRREVRDLSSRMQKLEGRDGRTKATSNETVAGGIRCDGKPNQSGIVEGDCSGSIAGEMTKLLRSIESSMHEFRTSLHVVQENMNFVNQSLNEIANNPRMPGIEAITALHFSHKHDDVTVNTNGTLPTDCWDVYKSGYNVSGVYKIKPVSLNAGTFFVYCQMDVQGGGWTVFQNRYDGQVNFYQNWKHYKSGFGNLNAEFWLGLDHIHELTNSKVYELLIELRDFDSQTRFATYDRFLIGSEAESYPILLLGAYKGNAGDSFTPHAGQKFTTWDMDNDKSGTNCAVEYIGAWWHNACFTCHLNGPYLGEKTANPNAVAEGISWLNWRGYKYSLKESRMSIRPRGVAVPKETN